MKAAKNETRTWLLRCVKCKSRFEVGISPSESIILIARKTLCPNCGHLPKLARPDVFLSAVQIHRLIRINQKRAQSRRVEGQSNRRLRNRQLTAKHPTSTCSSKGVSLDNVALRRIAEIVWGPDTPSPTRTRRQ